MKKVTKKYHVIMGENDFVRYEIERELSLLLELSPDKHLTFEKLANAQAETFEFDALEKEDIEKAITDFLGRPVTLSDVDCTVIYWIHSVDEEIFRAYPDGVGLTFQVGDDCCDDDDLFLNGKDEGSRYWNGTEISAMGLDYNYPFPDEIFAFDVSEFKSFSTKQYWR